MLKHQKAINQQLNYLYQLFNKHEDKQAAEMLIDLYEKYTKDEFVLTFAGHFSAGKSSMINEILDEEVLPNSPIPTSANIVKIKSGTGDAKVHFNDQRIVHYEAPYNIEVIKDFCTNKTNIHLVELSSTTANLPAGVTIIDTPGIDAADDYDRQLTESSLHLTDILFYMMDYNHVQSEVNLLFLKQLQAYNIPFYIIINQIDKHSPDEISFNDYKLLIKQTLLDWQLEPLGIFFTSLKDFSLENNDLEILKKTISQLNKESIDINRSLNHLIKDHQQYLHTVFTEKVESISINQEEKNSYEQSKILRREIDASRDLQLRITEKLNHELNQTLNNAYLMPYETREQARVFLDSQQRDFKVGFFNSRQKTKLEQEKRLNSLYNTILSTIDRTITWGLREKIRHIIEEAQIVDQQINQAVQSIGIKFSKDHLEDLVHQGAVVNGAYVLNYTKQVTDQIKQLYKESFANLLDTIETTVTNQVKNKQLSLDQYNELKEQYEQKLIKQKDLQDKLADQLAIIDNALKVVPTNETEDFIGKIIKARQVIKPENLSEDMISSKNNLLVDRDIDDNLQSTKQTEEAPVPSGQLDRIVDRTIEIIEDLPGFSTIVEDLQQKKARLVNRQLTIALFGAFSAGKSSFANALMGEYILPSSPNPMTAAITQIHPVTKSKPHGSIIVSFKDEQTIFNDLLRMLDEFNLPKDSLEQLINSLRDTAILSSGSLNQMIQVYVHSIVSGYDTMKQNFGKQLKVSYEEFSKLATDETKASFVAAIDLYYSSELTDQGITLVDTPGADSIHARHTDISFNYIKNADAIIYVTYYNHAFAKADKDFIMQLGRVKEAFELDKMFFIVNAADLATDDTELNVVVEHVKDELLNLGVRFPNIYPLSSKQVLENKLAKIEPDEHMQTFEQSFDHFIKQDLTKIVTDAIVWDIKRIRQLFSQHIDQAALDQQAKDTVMQSLEEKQTDLIHVIVDQQVKIYETQVIERIKRQLYYVKERFAIRYHDLFRENFNPTTIKTGNRQELEGCLKQLVSDTQFEWLQEMRAISLRIESYIHTVVQDLIDDREQTWLPIDNQFLLPRFDPYDIKSPTFDKGFNHIDYNDFNRSLRMFRGMRSFFEQRESEDMKDAIYKQMIPYIDKYLSQTKQMLLKFYQQAWRDYISYVNTSCESSVRQYINQQITMLNDPIDINLLKNKSVAIQTIIEQIEGGGVRE